MSGDPTKASLWADADVFISTDLDAAEPATWEDDFPAEWELVGLLDGDAGFVHSRSEDVTDHFAWGGVLVKTGRKHFKQTVAFTALEDNDVTRALLWPGSSETDLVVPRPVRVKIALEKREDEKVHRLMSALSADVVMNGDLTENESDLTKYPFIATVFPTGDSPGVLWHRQDSDATGS